MNIAEFKDIIIPIISLYSWDIEIDGELLRLRLKDSVKEFILSEQELDAIYDRIKENRSGNYYELYYNSFYEVILVADTIRFLTEEDVSLEDSVNHIKYKYDKISKELVLLMLLNLDTNAKRNYIKRFPSSMMRNRIEGMGSNCILDLFSELLLRYNSSLKITTENGTSLERFKSYALSYTYTYMYNRQLPMYLFNDIQIGSNLSMYNTKNKDFDSPKKIYIPELISYYNEAISSSILPHRFLSFYHILEYFYEKVFTEDQIKKAREIITDVSFSYKRDKDIAKLIKGIQQRTIDKDVAINEKNALSLLIQKHIKQDDLKTKLTERNGDNFLSVLNNKVSFSDGNAIIFSSEQSQFVRSLTERIYKTRNSIVHSKESLEEDKKCNKYKRIKDDKELLQEIALIQVMAEIIINEESKPI